MLSDIKKQKEETKEEEREESPEENNGDRRDAIRKYVLSRVPVGEYDGSFRMPELIIRNPIELERLVLNNSFTRGIVRNNGEWNIEYKPSPIK